MRKLFFLILVVVPIVFLSGCLDDNENEKTFTITFDANGGKFYNNSTAVYKYSPDPYYYPSIPCARVTDFSEGCFSYYPRKDGYFFIDWKSNRDGTGFSYSYIEHDQPSANMTFYAQWGSNNEGYTIHFETTGGSVVPSVTGVVQNTMVPLPTNADTTKDGYKLLGWFVVDYTPIGRIYNGIYTENFSLIYHPLKNIYLTAIWYRPPEPPDGICTVNFDTLGGVLDDLALSSMQIACGSEIILPSATKYGAIFSGWHSYRFSREFVYPGKYPAIVDDTLYAIWHSDGL